MKKNHGFLRAVVLNNLCVVLAVASLSAAPIYLDPEAPLEKKVQDLFSQLNEDEKLSLLTGTTFTTQAIPRLGVPPMVMSDAGQGVRGGMQENEGSATLYPAGDTVTANEDITNTDKSRL